MVDGVVGLDLLPRLLGWAGIPPRIDDKESPPFVGASLDCRGSEKGKMKGLFLRM